MNWMSLFDGMAGARIAAERSGLPVTNYYASEIDKYAKKVAQANYPDIIQLGDIKGINSFMLEFIYGALDIDLLIGGFPCQSYSIAGKREGINSSNGQLINEVFRILKDVKPKMCLFENVMGLMSIDNGDTFNFILKEINNCGYAVDFININSNLVSAQDRNRIYIIAKRLDECKVEDLYELELTKESKKCHMLRKHQQKS